MKKIKTISIGLNLVFMALMLASAQAFSASVGTAAKRRADQRYQVAQEKLALLKNVNLPTSTPEIPKNFFQKFRQELDNKHAEEMKLSKSRGALVHSMYKLPIDTFGFFIATGLVNYLTMYTRSGGNPLLFEEQVQGLVDPIANFSFYSFMAANGVYINFRTNHLNPGMSMASQRLAMRRFNYQGMALGSLASTLTADILTPLKSCSNAQLLISSSEDKEKITQANQLCQQALEIWTTRKFTEKYMPQIMSLLVVQAATDVVQFGITGTGNVTKSIISSLAKNSKFVVDTASIFYSLSVPGAAVKFVSLFGKIFQFTMFVGLDHLLNNTVTRAINNELKPRLFTVFNEKPMDNAVEIGNRYQWDEYLIQNAYTGENSAYESPESGIPKNNFSYKEYFPQLISEFSLKMQEWRDHLNSNVDLDLNQWMSETMSNINQVQISEKFYRTFQDELFETSNTSYQVETEGRQETAYNGARLFPYRTLPLFGVRFRPWSEKSKNEDEYKKPMYLNYPNESEKAQSEFVSEVAEKFLNNYAASRMNDKDISFAITILKDLTQKNPMTQGLAIKRLLDYKPLSNELSVQAEFGIFRNRLYSMIGNPAPKLNQTEGFVSAFNFKHSPELDAANFSRLNGFKKVEFNETASLLLHSMVCGNDKGSVHEINLLNVILRSPEFFGPRIVKNRPTDFCDFRRDPLTEKNLYTTPITTSNGETFKNITHFIVRNIKPEFLGDYRDENKKADMSAWWSSEVLTEIVSRLEKWDQEYRHLVEKLHTNLFQDKVTTVTRVDAMFQSNKAILSGTILDSIHFEKEFYLQLIESVQSKGKITAQSKSEFSLKIKSVVQKMILELKKSVTQLDYADQLLTEEQLLAKGTIEGQMRYSVYLKLQNEFNAAIEELEQNKTVSELEKAITEKCVEGLKSIESNIHKYVKMKLLMRFGLKLSQDEIKNSARPKKIKNGVTK